MVRWSSRDALLRIAVVCVLSVFYYTPLRFLEDKSESAAAAARRVAEIRLWLGFMTTLVAALGTISTELLVASCVHAALHFLQAIAQIPLRSSSSRSSSSGHWSSPPLWCWQNNCWSTCVCEYGSLVSFLLVLRYVLLPLPSMLTSWNRHRKQLQRFFEQHDRKYVSHVDNLLEDYTGNERLLFARIRKIYRSRPQLRTP